MNLTPWKKRQHDTDLAQRDEPMRDIFSQFRREIDQVFDRFLKDPFGSPVFPAGMSEPRVDLSESEQDITVRMDLPGVSRDDVDVSITHGVLTVRGERKEDREREEGNTWYSERHVGQFVRQVQLPQGADPDKVDATFKDGVLTLKIAKTPGTQPRRVEVKGA